MNQKEVFLYFILLLIIFCLIYISYTDTFENVIGEINIFTNKSYDINSKVELSTLGKIASALLIVFLFSLFYIILINFL